MDAVHVDQPLGSTVQGGEGWRRVESGFREVNGEYLAQWMVLRDMQPHGHLNVFIFWKLRFIKHSKFWQNSGCLVPEHCC